MTLAVRFFTNYSECTWTRYRTDIKNVGVNFSKHSEAFEHRVWSFSAQSFRKNYPKGIIRHRTGCLRGCLHILKINNNVSHRNDPFKQETYRVDLVMNWLDLHEIIWSITPASYLASSCCSQHLDNVTLWSRHQFRWSRSTSPSLYWMTDCSRQKKPAKSGLKLFCSPGFSLHY